MTAEPAGDLFGPCLGMPVKVVRWEGDGPHSGTLHICRDDYKVARFFDGSGWCHMEVELGKDGIWRPIRRGWKS